MLHHHDQQPKFLQTYFYDANEQTNTRMEFFSDFSNFDQERAHEILEICRESLQDNSYLRSFLSAKEVIDSMEPRPRDIFISLNADIKPDDTHRGRLNLPANESEIAILLPNEIRGDHRREVISSYCHPRDGTTGFKKFDHTHRSYDLLQQYPLLFPAG